MEQGDQPYLGKLGKVRMSKYLLQYSSKVLLTLGTEYEGTLLQLGDPAALELPAASGRCS